MKFDYKEKKALEIVSCAIIAISQKMNTDADREIMDIEILGALLDTKYAICWQGDRATTRRMNHRLTLLDAYIHERQRQNDLFVFPYCHNLNKKNEFFEACLQIPALRYTAIHTQTNHLLSLYKYAHDFLRWLKTKVRIAIDKNADGMMEGFSLGESENTYYDVEYDDDIHQWVVKAPVLNQKLQKSITMIKKEEKVLSDPEQYMSIPKFDANKTIEYN